MSQAYKQVEDAYHKVDLQLCITLYSSYSNSCLLLVGLLADRATVNTLSDTRRSPERVRGSGRSQAERSRLQLRSHRRAHTRSQLQQASTEKFIRFSKFRVHSILHTCTSTNSRIISFRTHTMHSVKPTLYEYRMYDTCSYSELLAYLCKYCCTVQSTRHLHEVCQDVNHE